MNTRIRQTDSAIRAVRKETLKALEKASGKCLAIFPDADKDPETARLVFNIMASQAHESLDLFLRQFAQALDASLGDYWLQRANTAIEEYITQMEAGV